MRKLAARVLGAWGAVALLAAVVSVTGCTGDGKRFVPIQGEAGRVILYVYRENGIVGRGLDFIVLLNGEPLTQLGIGTYYATRIDPGEIDFEVRVVRSSGPLLSGVRDDAVRDNILLRVTVGPGGAYYVKVEEGLGYVLIEPVDAEDAWTELVDLKLAPAASD